MLKKFVLCLTCLFVMGCSGMNFSSSPWDSAIRDNNRGCEYEEKGQYAKAIEYYQKSAEAGLYLGMFNLGRCYYHGIGVPKNLPYAVSLMIEPARAGMAKAQYVLGCSMVFGIGVQQDVRNGIGWLNLAAYNGYSCARDLLQRLAYEANRRNTEYWLQRAREAKQAADAIEAQKATRAAVNSNYRARKASKAGSSQVRRPEPAAPAQPAVPDLPVQKQPIREVPDKL